MRPTDGIDQAGAAQRHQDLVEEWSGDLLPASDFPALQGAPTGVGGQLDDGPHTILGLHRESHPHAVGL